MSSVRVLLAETSTIVLEIEKKYLEESEASIFTASRSEDVAKIARKVRPSLIYLAYNLPAGGGERCCTALKEDDLLRSIPVIMVCASADEKQRARDAGCDAVITRLDKREFLDAARSFLSVARSEDERISCRSFVQCTLDQESFFGTIEDLSMDGMFVGSNRVLKPGNLVLFRFLLPWSGAGLVKTSGQVSWVNSGRQPRNKRLPPGFGVNFQGVDPQAADQISDYLELMRKRLGE